MLIDTMPPTIRRTSLGDQVTTRQVMNDETGTFEQIIEMETPSKLCIADDNAGRNWDRH